jgi:DNA-binding GntR family transcriptional regulator
MSGAEAAPAEAFVEIVRRAEIHYTTVGEMVYGVIRQAILGGVFAPGQHLRQDALAEWIGVSRMPVRSALLQLESEGLVAFHPHRGAVVRALTPAQIQEIYEIRMLLEGHALRRAIENMTEERLARLRVLAADLDELESGERFAEQSLRFYRELYDHDRFPVLGNLIERLHEDVGRYLLGHRVLHRAEAPHARLLAYASSGDAEGAVRWLGDHLRDVAAQLAAIVGSAEQTVSG